MADGCAARQPAHHIVGGAPVTSTSDRRQRSGPGSFDHVDVNETTAFLAVLARRAPGGRTACHGWRVRDLVAHLAAGAQEEADLVEAALRGDPTRPTRPFAEREAAYRAMAYPRMLVALARQARQLGTAIDALARVGGTVEFTGVRMTARDLRVHGRSELAIHRWDLVGDAAAGRRLLAQPALTAHAVNVLTAMTSLQESVAARAARLAGVPDGFTFRLRSPDRDDVLVRLSPAPVLESRAPGDGVPVVRSSAAHRLLMLWGRRPAGHRVDMSGVPASVLPVVEAFLRV